MSYEKGEVKQEQRNDAIYKRERSVKELKRERQHFLNFNE